MEDCGQDKEGFEHDWAEFMERIGDDCRREGLVRTPQRFLAGLGELLQKPADDDVLAILRTTFEAPHYDDWVCLEDIPFHSICEHHLLPFHGTISIAYWPAEARVVGLSKMVRLVDFFSHRLQLQERLTVQIAEAIHRTLHSRAAMVRIEARHLCMEIRGVKRNGVRTTTFHRCGEADRWPF